MHVGVVRTFGMVTVSERIATRRGLWLGLDIVIGKFKKLANERSGSTRNGIGRMKYTTIGNIRRLVAGFARIQ